LSLDLLLPRRPAAVRTEGIHGILPADEVNPSVLAQVANPSPERRWRPRRCSIRPRGQPILENGPVLPNRALSDRQPGGCTRSMDASVLSLPTVSELRGYVLETLCAHDRLDPQTTPLYQGLITRRGQPCGLFFQAQ